MPLGRNEIKMNSKIKNLLIIILVIILIIMIIVIINLKNENNKINKELETGITKEGITEEQLDNIDQKVDLANTKIIDYEYNIIESKLTNKEKETLEKMKKEIKNTQNEEEKTKKLEEVIEINREYMKKYITSSEQEKIENYQKKLDKIEEKYNKYLGTKIDIHENGSTKEKEINLKNLRQDIEKELDSLGDLK